VKYLLLLILLVPSVWFFLYPFPEIEITPWYNNADAALSITFDDCDENQYLLAHPLMEQYGMRGSFGVVTSWVGKTVEEPEKVVIRRMSWEQIENLGDNEISSHSHTHTVLTGLSEEELLCEIEESKRLIEKHTGVPCITMHYPYSQTNESVKKALRDKGYLCARTLESAINSDPDLYEISSYAIFDDDHPSHEDLEEAVVETQETGGWIVLMYHHIDEHPEKYSTGPDLPLCLTPATFEEHMQLFSSTNFWIAQLGEVARYTVQKASCEIAVKRSFSKVTVLVRSAYDLPLTLKVQLNWWRARVEGSLTDGVYTGETIYLNVLPNKEVVIYREWI
jgi:peptidoglycan/xylan/chitin deacetylase (PgdA/CDA1 family)